MANSSLAEVTPAEAQLVVGRAQRDPAWFCREVLGCDPYDKQVEMIEAVRDHDQVSVVGANAVGKDWMVGRIVCWWLATRSPAKAIVTGPTARQISDIVWREARGAFYAARVPLGGRMLPTESRWEVSDEHFALGFSTDKPWNLTGFHSPHLLVVVSEAHNFGDQNLVSLKRLLPNRLLLTGNPFSESGEFFESHHDKRHLYHALAISAYDTPNVILDNEDVPGVVTRRDIAKMAADWGEDSPLYRATVLSEFAATADGLLPLAWLMRAKDRDPGEAVAEQLDAGIDVAGAGEDETVLTIRCGATVLSQKGWVTSDGEDWGHVVAELLPHRTRLRSVNVDSIGVGWGLYLILRDIFGDSVVHAINVGEAPTTGGGSEPEYRNLKAQLYWGLRERFKDGDVHGLPAEAISQLASLRYKHNSRGQIEIESKDDARKRGVKSPDKAESLMLAFAETQKGAFEWL